MTHVLDAARDYIRRGYCPVPIPYQQKKPFLEGWQNLRLTEEVLPQFFDSVPMNVGLHCGEPSGGLLDVDCDCPEAKAAAAVYLPPTGMLHGRPGNPRSHFWFRAIANVPPKVERYQDVPNRTPHERATLVELRSTGGQTVVPPSVHPSGEPYEWNGREPAEIDGQELAQRVALMAAVTLIARHWPAQGARHDAALALAGMLLRHCFTEPQVRLFVATAAGIAGDEEIADREQAVSDTALALKQQKHTTGLPTLRQFFEPAVIERLETWLHLKARQSDFSSHISLISQPATSPPKVAAAVESPPGPLAEEALHGLAGDLVRTIEPHTEADPAGLLMQFLVSFGDVIGRSTFYQVEASRHYLNLFAVLVGQTSRGRKGTSFDHIRMLLHGVDPDWAEARIQGGLSSGEGLLFAVRDPLMAREPIKQRGKIIDYQDVLKDEGETDKRLLVKEGEFARTLKVMEREGNTLSALLRDAWDTGNLRVMTKTQQKATGAHISIVGHITREELRRLLTDTDAANGFANRFLWVYVRRSKLLPDGGALHTVNMQPLVARLQAAVTFAGTVGQMRRDEEARETWRQVYPDLTREEPGLYGAVISRAEAQVLRLSCLYALLDQSATICRPHLRAALALWEFCEQSARYIFGDALGDPVADQLLAALRRAPQGLARTEISNVFGRHEKAGRLAAALTLLQERGLTVCQKVVTDGRPSEVWTAVQAAKEGE